MVLTNSPLSHGSPLLLQHLFLERVGVKNVDSPVFVKLSFQKQFPGVPKKKTFLKKFTKFTEKKTYISVSFLIKLQVVG